MVESTYEIEIKAQLDTINKQLNGLEKRLGATTKKGTQLANTIRSNWAPATIAIGAGLGAIVAQAARFEAINTQFEVLTGNTEDAAKAMKDLKEFSAGTPFQFEDIANAGKKLLGFGFEVDELRDRLREIGDVSAAVGAPLNEVALIFGQVRAAGKLTGERLLQFQERAIPIGPAIAKTLGVAETAVKDLVSRGEVDFETFQRAFASISAEGGLAFGGLEKASQTLEGKISTLKDNLSILAGELGKELVPLTADLARYFTDAAKSVNAFLANSSSGGKSIAEINKEIAKTNEQIEILQRKKERAGDGIPIINAVFGSVRDEANQQIAELEIAIQKLTTQRDALQSDSKSKSEEAKQARLQAQKEEQEQFLLQRQEFEEELKRLDEELSFFNEEKETTRLDKLQTRINKEQLLEKKEKIDKLAREKKFLEARQQLRKINDANEAKRLAEAKATEQKIEQLSVNARLGLLSSFGNLSSAILGQNNKATFLLQKAAAIAQTIVATNVGAAQALALGPIGIPIAATIKTAGAVNLAAIAATTIQGLADGGLVTGASRSPNNTDTIPALLQTNELVAPRRNFDEVVEGVARQRGFVREGETSQQEVMVTVGFTDEAFEIIEQKLIERQALGVG